MDKQVIYTKTAKGLAEAIGKTKQLSRGLRSVLKEINGSAPVELVQSNLGNLADKKLEKALEQLLKDSYIRIFDTPRQVKKLNTVQTPTPDDIDFSTIGSFQESLLQLTMSAFYNAVEAQNAADATAPKEDPVVKSSPPVSTITVPKAITEADPKIQALAEYVQRLELEARVKQAAKEKTRKKLEEAQQAKLKAQQETQEQDALQQKQQQLKQQSDAQAQVRHEAQLAQQIQLTDQQKQAATDALSYIQAEEVAQEKSRHDAEELARQQLQEKIRAEEQLGKEAVSRAEELARAEEHKHHQNELNAKQVAEELQRKVAQGRARMELEKKAQEDEARRKAKELAEKEAEQRAAQEAQQTAMEAARLAREKEERLQHQANLKRQADIAAEAATQATRALAEQQQREYEIAQAAEIAKAEQLARVQEQQSRIAAEAKAKQEALQRTKAEEERQFRVQQARIKAETKAKQEALERQQEQQAKEQQAKEQQAKEQQAKEQQAKAQREALELAKAEEQRIALEKQRQLEAQAREKQEQEAAEQARLAKLAAEEQARIQAEVKAQQDALALEEAKQVKKAKEAEQERLKKEEQSRLEEEAKAKQRALELAKAEEQRIALEKQRQLEAQAKEKQEREAAEQARLAKLAAEEQARIQAEVKAQQDALALEEAKQAKKAKEAEQERLKKEEQSRLAEQAKQAQLNAEAEASAVALQRAQAEEEALIRQSEEERAINEATERHRLEGIAREQLRQQVHQRTASMYEEEERARKEKDQDVLNGIEALKKQQEIDHDQDEKDRIARQEKELLLKQQAEEAAQHEAEELKQMHAQIEARELARQLKLQARAESQAATASQWSVMLSRAANLVVNKIFGSLLEKLSLIVFASAIVAIAAIHFTSFDRQAAIFEKSITSVIAQPAKINGLYFALLPRPHWRAEGVTIGDRQQIQIAEISVAIDITTVFDDKISMGRIDINSAQLDEEAAGWILFNSRAQSHTQFGPVYVEDLKLNSPNLPLALLEGYADFDANGHWNSITLDSSERQFHAVLSPNGARTTFEMNADDFTLPFGINANLKKFHSAGNIDQDRAEIKEFGGSVYDGVLSGSGTLRWGDRWTFSGNFSAIEISLPGIAPRLFSSGKMKTKGRYTMQSKTSNKLFSAPRIDGSFNVGNGELTGINIMSALKSTQLLGRTSFTELSGNFTYNGSQTQLQNIRLNAGIVSASGFTSIDANAGLYGRFSVDLRSPTNTERANISLSGKVSEPKFTD
ncbi:hypothetical protein AAKU61_003739 [Undibacterium sp. GrIS 1.2]|uniref:hypothetical protein n=1 Tax=Undibacterium sp. GrIS 1.2 TaxID=3143933 RepID=UPI0033971852